MADAKLSIVIEAVNKAIGELDSVKKQLGGIEAPAKKAAGSLTDLWSGMQMVMRGAEKAGQAIQAAFEFTKQGAQVAQLTASFEGLGGSISTLRDAAGGTIDDATLMGSTLTLLAGASNDTAAAMMNAAPQLIEIARAAAKLNPSLGDTAFLYQSLGTGIKRTSPMILDNLGLTIKIEEANQRYASALGKTVDELTASEKQQALLNETLRAGNVLIEQAGDSVDSLVDPWTRLTTSSKNLTDSLKRQTAEGVGPLVDKLADFSEALEETSFGYFEVNRGIDMFRYLLGGTSKVVEEHIRSQRAMGAETERMAGLAEHYAQQQRGAASATSDSVTAFQQYTNAIAASQESGQAAAAALWSTQEAAAAAATSFYEAAAGLQEMSAVQFASEQLALLREQLDAGTISQQQYSAATHAILSEFGILSEAEESAQGALDSLRQSYLDGKISAEAYAMAVATLKSNIDAIDSKTVTVDIVYNDPGWSPNPGSKQVPGENRYEATGGQFWTTKPTRLTVGEGGQPELVTVTPATQVQNTWNVNFQGMNAQGAVGAVRMLQALYGAR